MNVWLGARNVASTPAELPRDRKLDIRHVIIDGGDPHDLRANGVHLVARQIIAEQIAAGHDSRLIFLREPWRELAVSDNTVPIDLPVLAGRKLKGRWVTLSGQLLDTITRDCGPTTVFHLHGARQPLFLSLARRIRALGRPYGILLHAGYSHLFDRQGKPTRPLPLFYVRHVERRVLEAAQFVQALTPMERETILRVAPRARVVLIPNAVYSNRFEGAPQMPQRPLPSCNYPVFGYLGRYELEHKGLDLLVTGFGLYRKSGGRGRLEMVGTGPTRDVLADMTRALGISDEVTVDGPLYGEAKAQAFARWHYFAAPSRFDSFPIGPIQAALTGLPLILTMETGLEGNLKQFGSGFVIGDLTPQAVCEALWEAERTPPEAWRTMTEAAYCMAITMGDWTEVARRLVKLHRGAQQ